MITLVNDGSNTTDSSTAIRMPGSESEMSTRRIRMVSVQPPKKPASSPMRLPTAPVSVMPTTETASEMRAP